LAATSGVKVLIARPLSMMMKRIGRFSLAAALRHSAIRPFCEPPSPQNTTAIRSSSLGAMPRWRSRRIERAPPTAYGSCSATRAQPPWKCVALS
jgi:hypothetical protein